MQVRRRHRRKQHLVRGQGKPPTPQGQNERWSMDFVHDRMINGRSLRLLTVHDDYTRECLWIEVDTSLSGARVTRVLDWLCHPLRDGPPQHLSPRAKAPPVTARLTTTHFRIKMLL